MGAAKGTRSWNAGTGKGWVDRRGYRWIRVAGSSVREHRYLMAQYLGRPLLASEIVHHKDGNTLNNSRDNLEVMANGQHTRKHHVGMKRPDEAKKAMSRAARDREDLRRLSATNAELLDTLRNLEADMEGHEDGAPDAGQLSKLCNHWLVGIRAAIAKAEGRS
jgi:hypothetical protein